MVMRYLAARLPDPQLLVEMEPEELGAVLLMAIKEELVNSRHVHRNNSLGDIARRGADGNMPYPEQNAPSIAQAVVEAWLWLEAMGLVIPAPGSNGDNGFRVLSRRADRIQSTEDFSRYRQSRMLSKEQLHPKMADKVWSAFLRGEYDVAVFQAFKAVEVYVREASGLKDEDIGTALMYKAFADDGPLTDTQAEGGEKQARKLLFSGAIGSYKNPNSHRDVDLQDPQEAMELVMLANHLMRIVDRSSKAVILDHP